MKMKVVLFCGGLGMRLREYSDKIPKPMVPIGYRPILWNVMKYYSHYGHKDFILCLGFQADMIKDYFVNYHEYVSNDFVFNGKGRRMHLLNTDIHDWTITFVDTGLHANIGQRLKAVENYLKGEKVFLANYSDGLTDMHLPSMIASAKRHGTVASFLCVRPTQSFHVVKLGQKDCVESIDHVGKSELWINGGYFVLRDEIFQYIRNGEELVVEPFQRLIAEKKVSAYKHTGFWAGMDTFKDKQMLDEMHSKGEAPWEVWKKHTQAILRISTEKC
jgi:glucose-1-phosphate cytidylyltransferase